MYLTYFIAKSEVIYEELVKILTDCGLQNYSGVTFYSYWFYDIALAALKLKQCFDIGSKKSGQQGTRL